MDYDAILEEWNILVYPNDDVALTGHIYEDKKERFPDGRWVITTNVVHGLYEEGEVVQTENSKYLLGKRYG